MIDLVNAGSGVDFGQGVYLDAQIEGEGQPVALVLPGAERVGENADLVTALSERFTVVAPSHPGFGRSPQPDWCRSVADLADIYLMWIERSGYANVTVIGLQFGGWVALEMAARRSRGIARLVLVDSVGVKFGGPTDRNFVDVFATARAKLETLLYADASRTLGDPGKAAESDVLEVTRNEEALACYGWAPYLHDPRLRHRLGWIAVPTMVVWGALDGIVPPGYGRRLAAEIPGARFEEVQAAGHRAQVDRPQDVARLITAFSA
jgi:pimeloyl-ACP methyl ester carboxylesterase